jgi:hypothetical protein
MERVVVEAGSEEEELGLRGNSFERGSPVVIHDRRWE